MKYVAQLLIVIAVLALAMNNKKDDVPSFILEFSPDRQSEVERLLAEANPDFTLRPIYQQLDVYRTDFPGANEGASIRALLEELKHKNIIISYQENKRVTFRSTPNDPMYEEQWDMQRINMDEAWDLATGGTTADGDDIVVAILDAGFDTLHAELLSNYWFNRHEIPGDGIDNDGNGYTDDYYGLNTQTGNDNHEKHFHGTGVAGIIGATGNNMLGVSGVNWNVKILLISGIQRESDIIEGYGYIRSLRQRYNASDGAEGAFIVASNLSAGIDGEFAQDHPIWCSAYDDMGSVGILNVAATTNSNVFVDEEGDMPSTCLSEYLVMVTNTTIDDKKMNPAGYGTVNIDLGAPGTTSRTTNIDQGYQDFPGTSAATPHVTGVATLLYSLPCPDFIEQVRTDPAGAALVVKSAILEGTDKLDNLLEYTKTGGRLNALKSAQNILEICNDATGELHILKVSPNPVSGESTITYQTPDFRPYDWYIFDSAGRLISHESLLPAGSDLKTRSLDLTNYPAGVYFILLEGNGAKSAVKVVVPQ